MQGNHLVLVYGKDLAFHSGPISKILRLRLVSYARQLMKVLKDKSELAAADEVRLVSQQQAQLFIDRRIKLDLAEFET